ncbi:MAG: hypothetical protein ABIJ95_01600 [Pseudomonadota bacterium]
MNEAINPDAPKARAEKTWQRILAPAGVDMPGGIPVGMEAGLVVPAREEEVPAIGILTTDTAKGADAEIMISGIMVNLAHAPETGSALLHQAGGLRRAETAKDGEWRQEVGVGLGHGKILVRIGNPVRMRMMPFPA